MKKPGAKKQDHGPMQNYMKSIPKGVKRISHLPVAGGSAVVYILDGVEVKKVFRAERRIK